MPIHSHFEGQSAPIRVVNSEEEKNSSLTVNIAPPNLPYQHDLKPRGLVLSHQAHARFDLRMPRCLSHKRSGKLGKRIYDHIRFEELCPLPAPIGKPYKLISLNEAQRLDIDRATIPVRATVHCLSGAIVVTSLKGKYSESVVLSAESDVVVAPSTNIRIESLNGGFAEILLLEVGSRFAFDDEPEIYALAILAAQG